MHFGSVTELMLNTGSDIPAYMPLSSRGFTLKRLGVMNAFSSAASQLTSVVLNDELSVLIEFVFYVFILNSIQSIYCLLEGTPDFG